LIWTAAFESRAASVRRRRGGGSRCVDPDLNPDIAEDEAEPSLKWDATTHGAPRCRLRLRGRREGKGLLPADGE
jgi:hypothetical protein